MLYIVISLQTWEWYQSSHQPLCNTTSVFPKMSNDSFKHGKVGICGVSDKRKVFVNLLLSNAYSLSLTHTHTFICHPPTLSGWLLCVSYYQHILILPSWNNNMAGTQTTQQNWTCSGTQWQILMWVLMILGISSFISFTENLPVGPDNLVFFYCWDYPIPEFKATKCWVWKRLTLTPSSGSINTLHYLSNTTFQH